MIKTVPTQNLNVFGEYVKKLTFLLFRGRLKMMSSIFSDFDPPLSRVIMRRRLPDLLPLK